MPVFSNLLLHDLYSNSLYKQDSDPVLNLRPLGLGVKFAPRPAEPNSAIYQSGVSQLIRSIVINTTDFLILLLRSIAKSELQVNGCLTR